MQNTRLSNMVSLLSKHRMSVVMGKRKGHSPTLISLWEITKNGLRDVLRRNLITLPNWWMSKNQNTYGLDVLILEFPLMKSWGWSLDKCLCIETLPMLFHLLTSMCLPVSSMLLNILESNKLSCRDTMAVAGSRLPFNKMILGLFNLGSVTLDN